MIFHLDSENDPLIRRIGECVHNGTVSHACIVEGPVFIDKPAFARSFAKGILCPKQLGENCGECATCEKIDHDNHEDLIYVRKPSSRQTIGIGQIQQMQEQISIKPNGDRYVVIIEEGDLMTDEAQNCLLKTLEEPPGETVLLLLTDNSQRLLPTIRSRCIRYRIEGRKTAEESLTELSETLLGMLLQRKPFYQTRRALGDKKWEKSRALELIDCMEERCREHVLSRDKRGVLSSPQEIGQCIDMLESAREQILRGMTPGYALKRVLLAMGG